MTRTSDTAAAAFRAGSILLTAAVLFALALLVAGRAWIETPGAASSRPQSPPVRSAEALDPHAAARTRATGGRHADRPDRRTTLLAPSDADTGGEAPPSVRVAQFEQDSEEESETGLPPRWSQSPRPPPPALTPAPPPATQPPAANTDVRFLQPPSPATGAVPLQPPALPQFPTVRESVPLGGLDSEGDVNLTARGGRISLTVRDASLSKVLAVIAQQMRLNIVSSSDTATATVNITLDNVPLDDALSSILGVHGYTWVRHRNIIHVTSTGAVSNLAPETQGRQMRVFPLHYALGSDVEPVVRGLISPVGKVFHTASSPADNRKTQETLVVEDLPGYLERIGQFIALADVPPRQVLIEAHLLQIDLKDENRHGVNLSYLSQLGGHKLKFQVQGMANPLASPGVLFTFDGSDLDSLVELLKTTTDSKTLASPRVLVINGQEARIQIGAQLGFRVTTTTQTSTLQSVNFLDVGVVLRVTPRISPTGQVLMHVKPEVSSGKVNPTTGLPEEETTEVETDILLDSGQGVVIGGLIQEKASDTQNKLPWLGDLPLLGRLFQHRQNDKERSEIVIALVPRVMPYDPVYQSCTDANLYRATSPILDHQLRRLPRDDGYMLQDAWSNPIRPLRVLRLPPVECLESSEEVLPQTSPFPPAVAPEQLPPPTASPSATAPSISPPR